MLIGWTGTKWEISVIITWHTESSTLLLLLLLLLLMLLCTVLLVCCFLVSLSLLRWLKCRSRDRIISSGSSEEVCRRRSVSKFEKKHSVMSNFSDLINFVLLISSVVLFLFFMSYSFTNLNSAIYNWLIIILDWVEVMFRIPSARQCRSLLESMCDNASRYLYGTGA